MPIRNCSTSKGAVSQSIPICSPICRASSAVNVFPVLIARLYAVNMDLG